MPEEPEFEEMEQIPWSALAARTPNPMIRIGWVIAATVAAVVVGIVVARGLLSGDEGTQVTLPAPVAVATTAAVQAQSVTTDAAAAPEPDLYSEADLMAVAPEVEATLAVMRAEWFVRDFFTVDGDQALADRMAELVGPIQMPQPGTGGAAYVEWTRAFAVDATTPGRYEVSVAYRLLQSSGEAGFSRNPVRAVVVTIGVDADGAMTIVDLPAPASLPATLPIDNARGEVATPPADVVAAALESAGMVGPDPAVLAATRDVSGWRVVVAVGDPSGLRWPIAVRVDS